MPEQRILDVTTDFDGDSGFLAQAFRGNEHLSEPYRFVVQMESENLAVAFDEVMGKSICVHLIISDELVRHFCGVVDEFEVTGMTATGMMGYQAVLVPSLRLLDYTTNCRIFQNQSVVDIIKTILAHHDIQFRLELGSEYSAREYYTQYGESDLAFISRLMEEEGIYYFFEHTDTGETLVLADDLYFSSPWDGAYAEIPYHGADQSGHRGEGINELTAFGGLRSNAADRMGYNYTQAGVVNGKQVRPRNDSLDKFEEYSYWSERVDTADGHQRLSRIHVEQTQCAERRFKGTADARGICPGYSFEIAGHGGLADGVELLAVSANYLASTQTGFQQKEFTCQFEAMDNSLPFRPDHRIPKPLIHGPQTAVVIGDSGPADTDEYGRVQVKFHWERPGQQCDEYSCWVRVSQMWAGKDWGGMTLPHKGHEVVVSFLDGDPDQPIVTGRVYNAANRPWLTPNESGNDKRLVIRDHVGNRMVLDGSETGLEIFTPEEQTRVSMGVAKVGHKAGIDITPIDGNDSAQGGLAGYKVQTDANIALVSTADNLTDCNNHHTQVTANAARHIGGNSVDRIDGTEKRTIGKGQKVTVDAGGQTTTVTGGQSTTVVSGNETFTAATGAQTIEATAGAQEFKSGTNQTFTVGANQLINITGNHDSSVAGWTLETGWGGVQGQWYGVTNELYASASNTIKASAELVNMMSIDLGNHLGLSLSNFIGIAMSNYLAVDVENGTAGIDNRTIEIRNGTLTKIQGILTL